ncbi:hypothetical protein JHU04_002456 [Brenneria sp. 4F2]|nr:hypothetical protein [Brenneria bubanii]
MNISKERLEQLAFAGDETAEMAKYILEMQKQEPVAWQFNWHNEGWRQCKNKQEYDEIITNGNNNFEVRSLYASPVPPAVPEDVERDALRYRFLRDKDEFGADNEPGLASWDDLCELGYNEFDAAVDARIAHPDINYVKLDNELRNPPAVPDEMPSNLRKLIASKCGILFCDDDVKGIWESCCEAMLNGASDE